MWLFCNDITLCDVNAESIYKKNERMAHVSKRERKIHNIVKFHLLICSWVLLMVIHIAARASTMTRSRSRRIYFSTSFNYCCSQWTSFISAWIFKMEWINSSQNGMHPSFSFSLILLGCMFPCVIVLGHSGVSTNRLGGSERYGEQRREIWREKFENVLLMSPMVS